GRSNAEFPHSNTTTATIFRQAPATIDAKTFKSNTRPYS
ncbi:MAG: hypothetical protein QOG75_5467, partial [Mycobacterium sp.]|nr:hypothetical protein [Mycobacterium sp.]